MPSAKEKAEKTELLLKISQVEPNRNQPRKKFDEDALLELAESIKTYGILQPLLVQKRDNYYEIIAGERRWRAAKMAGVKEVPVIIKNLTDQQIMEISLIENIQREDLNPIEEAHAYKQLLTEFHMKQDEIADRVSKSRSAITNSLRLLKLCDKVQQMIIDEKLTMGHVRPLIGIEDPTTNPSETKPEGTTASGETKPEGTTASPTTKKTQKKTPNKALKTTVVKKATKKKNAKKIRLSFRKVKGAKRYQVQVSENKKFTSVIVTKTVKKYKKVTISKKAFEKKKELFVRVRAVGCKKWSKPKKVRILKK